MSSRSTDVNLIIRARTEGEKAISSLGDAIGDLLNNANAGSADIAELGKSLSLLDKAAATIAGSVGKAGDALDRQRSSITENKAALAALVAQQEAAVAAADRIQSSVVDRRLAGEGTDQQIAQLRGLREEQQRLTAQADRLREAIRRQESEVGGAQSSLLKLSSTSRAIAEGQAAAEAQIELTTQALREQASAAERVTDIQRRINQVTGVDRPNAAGSAASVAEILAAADAEYRLVEARATHIQKLREEEAANTALAVAEERQRQFNTSQGITANPGGAQARESAQVFIGAANAEEQMAREAQALRDKLDPLAAIQTRVNDQLVRLRELAAAGKLSVNELATAEAHLAVEAEQARQALAVGGGKPNQQIGLFGLKPYELQNLGYQINDIVTQLASGTSLTQTLSQQGGQILQLFPKVGGLVVGALSNPALIAGVATIASLTLALKEAADHAARLRTFSADLAASPGLGGGAKAEDLNRSAEALDRYGYSAETATTAVQTFLREGVDPSRIVEFGEAAKNMADVFGTDLAQAGTDVATAFTGGLDAILRLNESTNFLTESQAANIASLFEQGRAAEARDEAFRLFAAAQQEAADKQRGEWSEATRSLTNAYDTLLKTLANTSVIEGANTAFSRLASTLGNVINSFSSVINRLSGTRNLGDVANDIANVQRSIRSAESGVGSNYGLTSPEYIDGLRKRLVELKQEYGKVEAAAKKADGDPKSGNDARDRIAAQRRQAEGALEIRRARLSQLPGTQRIAEAGDIAYQQEFTKSGNKALADVERNLAVQRETVAVQREANREAERGARHAQTVADQQERFLTALDATVEGRQEDARQLDREVGLVGKYLATQQRQAAIEDALAKARVGAAKAGIAGNDPRLTGRLKSLADATGTAFDSKQAVKIARFNEELDYQNGLLDQEIAERRSLEGLSGTALLRREREIELAKAERDLRRDGEKQGLAPDDAGLQARIVQARELRGALFDVQHARDELDARRDDAERPLNNLIEQRDVLREQAEFLRSIGENSQADAVDQQIQALGGSIQDAYDNLIAFYEALTPTEQTQLGILEGQLDNVIAKLKLAQARSQEWGKVLGLSGQQIAQTFANIASAAITNFIQRVAGGKDVFKSFGAAVREFAANFISSVGQMIIQLLAFAAVVQVLRALGVPVPSGSSIFDPIATKHTGGIVGESVSQFRAVDPTVFAGAQRFHTGGIAGFAPDEVPLIARRGEEVLTEGDPRHRKNLGGASEAPPRGDIKIVTVFDTEVAAAQLMRTKAGEKAMLNMIKANPRAFKAALG